MINQYDFDNGTIVEKDELELKLIVSEPGIGKYEISGFINKEEMHSFLMFGDFNKIDNDFFLITGSKTELKWTLRD